MDISGITPAVSAVSRADAQAGASIRVMEMAENAVEDTFSILLSSLDAIITGLGQSFDASI